MNVSLSLSQNGSAKSQTGSETGSARTDQSSLGSSLLPSGSSRQSSIKSQKSSLKLKLSDRSSLKSRLSELRIPEGLDEEENVKVLSSPNPSVSSEKDRKKVLEMKLQNHCRCFCCDLRQVGQQWRSFLVLGLLFLQTSNEDSVHVSTNILYLSAFGFPRKQLIQKETCEINSDPGRKSSFLGPPYRLALNI